VADQVLPFYLVYDQSLPMRPKAAEELDRALSGLFSRVNAPAPADDGVRLGLIGFDGGDTRVLVPLGGAFVSGSFANARRSTRTGTPFSAAFRLLFRTILDDAQRVTAEPGQYLRPVVFFMAAGNPTDDWRGDYQRLFQAHRSFHPEIVAFGLPGVDTAILQEITTTRKFLADDQTGPSTAMGNFLACVESCATDTGSALEKGFRAAFSPPRSVPGFTEIISGLGRAGAGTSPAEGAVRLKRTYTAAPRKPSYAEPAGIGSTDKSAVTPAGLPEGWHRVPDTVLDGADLDGLVIRGASLRGDGHRAAGTTRKDAMGIYRVREGGFDAIVACVAGGAEEAALSHLGAEQACLLARDEAAKRLSKLFGDPADAPAVGRDLIDAVAARLVRRAAFLNVEPAALSTSLAVAVVDLGRSHYFQRTVTTCAGHCNRYTFIKDDQLSQLTFQSLNREPPSSPPFPDAEVRVQVGDLFPGDVLMICTDGLGKPMLQDEVESHLLDSWKSGQVPGVAEFGWRLSFRAEDAADDRTAICLRIRYA
jgi:uncharacterized protein YegL